MVSKSDNFNANLPHLDATRVSKRRHRRSSDHIDRLPLHHEAKGQWFCIRRGFGQEIIASSR